MQNLNFKKSIFEKKIVNFPKISLFYFSDTSGLKDFILVSLFDSKNFDSLLNLAYIILH